MQTYKIILNNGEPIIISEEELPKVIYSIQNKGLVVTKMGIFNPSYLVEIIPNQTTPDENEWWKKKMQAPSPFAKLLSPKMKMLSDKEMTQVVEETAKEERRLKR